MVLHVLLYTETYKSFFLHKGLFFADGMRRVCPPNEPLATLDPFRCISLALLGWSLFAAYKLLLRKRSSDPRNFCGFFSHTITCFVRFWLQQVIDFAKVHWKMLRYALTFRSTMFNCRWQRCRSVSNVAECPGSEDAHRHCRVREAAGSLLQWAAWARRS